MSNETLIKHEIDHGDYIADKGEAVWNWSSPAGKLRWQRRSAMFREFLGNNGCRVLEVGCGTGLFTEVIAHSNNKITAIDVSRVLLDRAKIRVFDKNVIFCVEDAHQMSFPDSSFDYVVGSSVLHHLNVALALKEFYRVLKPGGKLMFTEPNMLNPQIMLERNIPFIRKLAHNSPDETAFLRWTLQRQMYLSGFKDVGIKPFDFMHPAIPQLLIPIMEPFCIFLETFPLIREIAGSLTIKAQK